MKANFLYVSLLSQKRSVFIFFIFLLSLFSNLRAQCTGVSVFIGNDIAVCDNQNVVLKPVVTISTPSRTVDSVKWLFNGGVVSTNIDSLVVPLSVSTQGVYFVNIWVDSCFLNDSVNLGVLDPGQIVGSQLICAGQVPNAFLSISAATIMTSDTLQYVWESSTDSMNWTAVSGGNLASFSPGALTQTTYFRRKVELVQNGSVFCFSNSNVLKVEIVSGLVVQAGQDSTMCPGNSYTFSGSVSGIGSYQPVYQWSGPGGFSDTTLTPTISSVSQADAGTYILSATIGSCVIYDTVIIDVYTISINSGQFNPGRTQLVECIGPGSSTGLIGFFPVLPSPSSLIQSVTIDWGDGAVQTIPSSGYSALQTHNYQAGSYSLSITVVVSAGCTTVLTYSVFVGSSPSPASLALFVNQANGCLPHSTSFTFNVPSANVDGTTYVVDWGDGSPTVTYTHPNTPPVLNHVYGQSSCGNSVVTSGTTYTNVFQPFVITKNPCSVQPQPSAAGLISVGVPPDASFTVSKEIICPDDEIQLVNTSDFGLSIPTGSGANCDTFSPYYWTITPNNSTGATNWSIVSGSLGSNNGFPGNPGFWSVGTLSPRVKFLVSGTYVIDLFVENDCGLSQYSDTICVIVPPVCSIELTDTAGCSVLTTSVWSSSALPTCDSFDLPVQYTWSVSNPVGCSGCSSSLASPSADSSGLTLINNSNSIQYFTVELTVTAIDSTTNTLLSNCESVCSRTIKVYPRVQISPLTSCNGQLNWNLTNQVNVPSIITWQATQNPNVSGETTGLQSSNLITDSLVNNSSTSQTVFYTVIATSIDGGCSDTQVFTVNLLAPIVIQPLSDDTLCVGGTLSSPLVLSYTGGINPPSYQWRLGGLVVSNSASFTPSTFTAPGNYSFVGSVTYGPPGCRISERDTVVITVVPDPVVTIQPVSDTYCLGASGVDTLVVSASGGLGSYSYQWYSSVINSNSGGTAIPGATTPRFVPSVGSVGTTYYYCEITQTGLNCNVSSATATILVTPAPTFSTQPITPQTICLDGTLSPLTVAYQNGTPGGTYQWYSNTTNSNTGGTLIPGATNASYTPPSNSTGTFYYYCVVTLPSGGCSSITSNVGVVIVRPHPLISVQPIPSQTICEGGTIDTALFASYSGGVGTPSYQWQKGGVNIPGATNSGYLPPSFNSADTVEFSVIISLSGSGCDSDTSQNGEVIIISDPVVSLQPTSASYCQNASPVASLVVQASGGLGSYSYQWYSNTNNSNSGGLLLPGETDSTFVPLVSLVGTTYYYCEIVQTGLNCNVTSSTASIIVTPAPTFTTQPIDTQTVCLDGSLSALTLAYQNGLGSPSYQWYSNTINSYTGSTLIPGATNLNYLPPTDSVGTYYYYCVVTLPNGGCSSITSDIAVVIVLPDPMISIQPIPAQTICEGGTILNPLTVSYAGGVGTPSYQWQNSGVNIVGANSASFTPSGISSPGIYSYSVIVNLSGNGCNADTSQNSLITVIPDPIVVVQPVSDTYCIGAVPVDTLVVSANGGLGMFSYQWYSNTTNSSTGGTPILGATDSTFVPSVGAVGTFYYYCEITQTGVNCNTVSLPATILVNPAPSFTTQPLDSQFVCLDGLLTSLNVTYQNGVGTPSYQWFVNSSNSYSGSVPVIGATNSNYLPPSTTVGTLYYYCVVSLPKGGCSSIVSDIAKVVVNPDPLITVQPLLSQSICVGGTLATPLSVSFSGGVGNPSYQWQKNGVNLLGDTNSSFLPTTFFVPDTIDYRVILSLDGRGCNDDTSLNAEVIIVNDPVMVREPDSAIYCENTSPVTPLLVRATGGLGSFNYQWYSNSINSNSGGAMITGATDSTFIPPVNGVGTVYYYCEISQSGLNCNVISAAAKITVTPSPSFSNQPIGFQKLCVGGTPNLLSVSYIGGNNSVSYQWYQNNVNSNVGGTPLLGQTSSSYLPPSSTSGSNFYYCVLSFSVGGCTNIVSNPAQVVVLDDPIITNQPVLSQMICQGTTILQPLTFSFSGGTGATSIAWYQFGTPNVLINGVTDTSFLPITFNLAGNYKYFAVVTDSGVGCDNTSTLNSEIIVNPTPHVNPLNDTVLCNDSRLNIQITTSVPSNITWSATQNINVTGELTSTQTSTLINDSLTNNTNVPQFVEYSITPTSFPEGCPGPDSTVRVKVQPDVVLNNVPNIEICSGSPVNTILTANVPSTFNWFVSIDNPNVTGESLLPSTSNLITDRLVNNTSVNQIVVYSVFPVSIEGQCAGLAQTFVVTVKPSLALLNEDTVTICSGNRVNLSLVANTNVTFNWYADQSLNVLNETTSVVSSSRIDDSLVNVSNSIQKVTYHVVGTSTSNGCSSPVIPITVFVNPQPSVFPISDTIICNGVTLSPISFNGPVIGTQYNWSTTDTTIGIGARTGLNSIPGFVTTNPTFSPKSTNFTVVPIYTNDSVTCIGNSESFTLTVLPSPDVNPLGDINVCNGIQVPQTVVSGSVPGTIFNWQNSNTSISLNVSGIGNIPSFNATNNTAVQQFSTVSVMPMSQVSGVQCFGAPETYRITVNPTPKVVNNDIQICSRENTNILLNSNIPSSFQWSATPTPTVFNETSFPIQTTNLINDTLSIISPFAQFVDYHVIPTSLPFGCVGPDSVITVQVNPIPVVDFSILNTIFCDLQPINFQNNSLGSLNFDWNFGDGNSSFLFNPSNSYASAGGYSITLTGTNPLTGCKDSVTKPIVISKTPNSNFTYSDSVGCDFLDVVFIADTTSVDWDYDWNFGNGSNSQQFGVAGHFYNQIGCNDVSLTVTSKAGCISTTLDTNAICIYEQPIADFISNRTIFSSLETPIVEFYNQSLFSTSYLWFFGDNQTGIAENPIHIYPDGANQYQVKLYASNQIGCIDSVLKTIIVEQEIAVYVPNTFTPNKDEINQVFLPILSDGFIEESYHLTIFNRWGELVFETRDQTEGWDGMCGAQDSEKGCGVGSYVWKISVAVEESSETLFYMGHVNLIR